MMSRKCLYMKGICDRRWVLCNEKVVPMKRTGPFKPGFLGLITMIFCSESRLHQLVKKKNV